MSTLGALRTYLGTPGAIALADGLAVRVDTIRQGVDEVGRPELVIGYTVPGIPSGVAHIPPDEPRYVAEELHAWATEHVRRYRPPELPSDATLSVELPGRAELWDLLVTTLRARPHADGLALDADGGVVTVVLTPERWQQYVFACERGARLDVGVDAAESGDGPALAVEDLEETVGSRSAEATVVVLTDHGFRAVSPADQPRTSPG